MDFLRKLFENGAITWEQFEQGVNASGFKIADLASGKYVDKLKYDEDIAAKDTVIDGLNEIVATRDKDLSDLNTRLAEADGDKNKVATLTDQLNSLQNKYEEDGKKYKAELEKQQYLSLAKDLASGLKFSSNAAKEMFINKLVDKGLKVEDGKILGADDFTNSYKEANADSFVVEQSANPQFTASTTAQMQNPATYETRLADARKAGNTAEAISIKREAAENGVILM